LVLENDQSERARSKGLEQALGALDARSRRIIEARWLPEQDAATLHELADEFGISAERIRQIEGQAMKKMRALMAPSAA
jgi:RNA polymerase sigma-32 factor